MQSRMPDTQIFEKERRTLWTKPNQFQPPQRSSCASMEEVVEEEVIFNYAATACSLQVEILPIRWEEGERD